MKYNRLKYSTITLILLQIGICNSIFSQTDTTRLVKYTPAFKFTEGFYIDFDQVKNNKPILKSRIITNVKRHDLDFFDKVVQEKTISFYDDYGIRQEYKTEKLWGYCRKGVLYIQVEGVFNRIPVVGRISHFVANITVYRDRYYNQYDPYYSYNSSLMNAQQPTTELKQFILDFETGKILEYNYSTLEILLMQDSELYQEYNKLRKRKKKQQMFLYLRKFNEKHPVYIPID